MPTRFGSFVARYPPATPILPPIHGTDAENGRTILEGRTPTLSPADCPVFGKPLLYFFYGRPAYRVAQKEKDRSDGYHSPVLFILKPDAVLSIKRVFPFDTGGYPRYGKYLSRRKTRDEFELETTSDTPQRHVTAFFDTNYNYFRGIAKGSFSVPGTEMEVQGYYNMITAKGELDFHDGCMSVELQVDENIPLTGRTLAVILPLAVAGSPGICKAVVKRLNAKLITYEEYSHSRPIQYHELIRERVRDFMREAGLL